MPLCLVLNGSIIYIIIKNTSKAFRNNHIYFLFPIPFANICFMLSILAPILPSLPVNHWNVGTYGCYLSSFFTLFCCSIFVHFCGLMAIEQASTIIFRNSPMSFKCVMFCYTWAICSSTLIGSGPLWNPAFMHYPSLSRFHTYCVNHNHLFFTFNRILIIPLFLILIFCDYITLKDL